jgi:monofunctional biosynthetic peptidoglycan transglycosylase
VRTIGRIILVICAGGFAYLAWIFLTIPDVRPLRTQNPATTAFIELRAGEARARGKAPRRAQSWVPYARMSPELVRAVLVTEDSAFWQHEGVDLEQIRESLQVNLKKGTLARGASTITQQLAKNLYLSPSKNPLRKLRELLIARRLEAELSKRRILEIYLNVIEWGDGIYGAEAAARAYFNKPAAALTAEEAALMAGAIFNPRVLNPGRPSPGLIRRQRLILQRMRVEVPRPTQPGAPGGVSALPQPYHPPRG